MFISPVLADPVKVLDVVVHENVHRIVGIKCGHKGAFKRLAESIGLTGKMTSTIAGPELEQKLLYWGFYQTPAIEKLSTRRRLGI